jgi:hypothetical protein
MTTDVVRVQGDYQIQTAQGGTLTLNVGTGTNTGTVIITGNLDVKGRQTIIESIVSTIKDNTIVLNAGEPTSAISGKVTAGTSGIKISRGRLGTDQDSLAAFIEWNDDEVWHGTGQLSNVNGLFEFRQGTAATRPQYSAIKVNAIRIDPSSASTAGAGAGAGPRLNIFGTDNPTSVISVAGTLNYEDRVTDNDDIPNKAYVDNILAAGPDNVKSLIDGLSYIKIIDNYLDGTTSQIIGVLDGDPTERLTITTGHVVMRITADLAQFAGIQFVDNQIESSGYNKDLRLNANGTGQIVLAAPLLFETTTLPIPAAGQTGLYTKDPAGGGTGVFFVTSSTLGVVTSDEFVSRKKALIYSIIF